MTHLRLGRVALVVLLAAGLAACGEDDGAQPGVTINPEGVTTSTATADGALPPPGALDLEPMYGDALAELGLKLTDRGGLIDRSGGGYVPSAKGTHLAMYVEPIGDRTVDEYIDGIVGVAAVFGDLFERWPGLGSYDVCQEPTGEDPVDGSEPLPVTQIELTKGESAAIDWDTVTVVDLVRASLARPPGLALRVGTDLAREPAYQAIVSEAS